MWLALVLTTLPADAGELAWQWESDTARRYVTAAYFQSPYVITLLEGKSGYVRAAQVGLKAVIRCQVDTALPKGKGWYIDCAVEDGSVWAVPVVEDQGRAAGVVHAYEEWLEKSTLSFKLSSDGRLTQPRLEVDGAKDMETRYMVATLERMLGRAISSLDTQLADPAEDSWPLRGPQATTFPFADVMSQFRARVEVVPDDNPGVLLETRFEGGYGYRDASYKGGGVQQIRFAEEAGCVRDSRVEIVAGANSTDSAGTVPYRLVAWTTEVEADETIALDASQGW